VTHTEARQIAQDVILDNGVYKSMEFTHELLTGMMERQPTDDEYKLIREHIATQANRALKFFGYEPKY
jgi:hypothetical protein